MNNSGGQNVANLRFLREKRSEENREILERNSRKKLVQEELIEERKGRKWE